MDCLDGDGDDGDGGDADDGGDGDGGDGDGGDGDGGDDGHDDDNNADADADAHPPILQGVSLAMHIGWVRLQRAVTEHHYIAICSRL